MRLHWGTGIAAVYTFFVCSTLGFVAFAMQQPVELVSADYYAQSLQYDSRIAAQANTRALGDAFSCTMSPNGRTISLRWPPVPDSVARGTVTLYRPSDSRADTRFAVSPDSHGEQQIALSGLASGRWRIRIEWDVGAMPYYYEREVDIR